MARNVKHPNSGSPTSRPSPTGQPDGRSSRWDRHREQRREDLVEAAVAAIDEHGPTAGIKEIADRAGVSKPVLYRYFADKADLYRAVGHWGANEVLTAILPPLLSDEPLRARTKAATDAYLTLLEQHPQVFLLLVTHPSDSDPLADGKELIAAALARVLGDQLRRLGVDAGGAEPWAQAIVGTGLSTGTWWLERRTMSRAALTDYLSAFIWHAFAGIAEEHGVRLDQLAHLKVVE